MPDRWREWIAFVLAVCALGVLVPLIVLRETQTSARPVHRNDGHGRRRLRSRQGGAREAPAESGTTSIAGVPTGARLVLTASRGDSRIVVRVRSARGSVLFAGPLAKGETRTFTEPVLWASFTAAENIDAHVNGQPLDLPSGAVSIVITPQGLG